MAAASNPTEIPSLVFCMFFFLPFACFSVQLSYFLPSNGGSDAETQVPYSPPPKDGFQALPFSAFPLPEHRISVLAEPVSTISTKNALNVLIIISSNLKKSNAFTMEKTTVALQEWNLPVYKKKKENHLYVIGKEVRILQGKKLRLTHREHRCTIIAENANSTMRWEFGDNPRYCSAGRGNGHHSFPRD